MPNTPVPPSAPGQPENVPEPGKRSGEGAASVLEFLRTSLKTKPALSEPPPDSPSWDAPTEPAGFDQLQDWAEPTPVPRKKR